jgi:hypothetical protein
VVGASVVEVVDEVGASVVEVVVVVGASVVVVGASVVEVVDEVGASAVDVVVATEVVEVEVAVWASAGADATTVIEIANNAATTNHQVNHAAAGTGRSPGRRWDTPREEVSRDTPWIVVPIPVGPMAWM